MGSAFNLSNDSGLLLLKQEHERPVLFFKSSFRDLVELRSTVLELLCSYLELSYYTLLELFSYYLEHFYKKNPFFLYLELLFYLFL